MDIARPFGVPERAMLTLARRETTLMLKLMTAPPNDLGKKGEMTKVSPTLDRATGDTADLRFYTSNDGKRTYLRVWETAAAPTQQDAARWYEVQAAPAAQPEDVTKKK